MSTLIEQDQEPGTDVATNLGGTVVELARTLLQDLRDLRAGKITNHDANMRAQLGREIMRAVNLQFKGMRVISSQAKLVGTNKARKGKPFVEGQSA